MSRQNRNQERERKGEETKRDVSANNERYSKSGREASRNDQFRNDDPRNLNGLDKHRLNDLYERSSI